MNLSSPLSGLLRDVDAQIVTALQRTADGLTGRRLESIIGSTSRSAFLAALERLQIVGLLERTDVGNSALYKLNQRHLAWKGLRAVLDSTDALEVELTNLVVREWSKATLAVFGSYARGDASLASDLDLVVVNSDTPSAVSDKIVDMLERTVALRTGNEAHVIILDDNTLAAMVSGDDPLVASWMQDSRTLSGVDLRRRIASP